MNYIKPLKIFILMTYIVFSVSIKAQDVVPTKSGEIYSLEVANVKMEVDASFGGRIVSYKIDDNEILYTNPSAGIGVGSILWTSPQSEWGWPPKKEIDENQYDASILGNKIYMLSDNVADLHITASKYYYGNTADTSITIDYSLINTSTSENTKAAWAVTRVPAKGVFFYPKGNNNPFDKLAKYVQTIDDYSWYQHVSNQTGNTKFKSDGKQGWFAHANNDGYLFIKLFEDVPLNQQASDEGEIELYLTSDHSYIEMENQGKYASIQPKDSLVYTVKWYLRKIPKDVVVEKGSVSLLNFVLKTLKLPLLPVTTENDENDENVKAFFSNNTNSLVFENLDAYDKSVRVYDITGKEIAEKVLNKSANRVELKQLKNGIYFYSLDEGIVGKFVKY